MLGQGPSSCPLPFFAPRGPDAQQDGGHRGEEHGHALQGRDAVAVAVSAPPLPAVPVENP